MSDDDQDAIETAEPLVAAMVASDKQRYRRVTLAQLTNPYQRTPTRDELFLIRMRYVHPDELPAIDADVQAEFAKLQATGAIKTTGDVEADPWGLIASDAETEEPVEEDSKD